MGLEKVFGGVSTVFSVSGDFRWPAVKNDQLVKVATLLLEPCIRLQLVVDSDVVPSFVACWSERCHQLTGLCRAIVTDQIHTVVYQKIAKSVWTGRSTKHDHFHFREHFDTLGTFAEQF